MGHRPHPTVNIWYLGEGGEVIGEVWHEVHAGLWRDGHAHTAEVRSGIAGHQRVSDAPHHLGQPDEGLRVLLVREEAVALHDGRLHIAELSEGESE